jgi:hypothetical protein
VYCLPLPPTHPSLQELQRGVRKLIIDCILATDLSNHFSLTSDFSKHTGDFSVDSQPDRHLLAKVGVRAKGCWWGSGGVGWRSGGATEQLVAPSLEWIWQAPAREWVLMQQPGWRTLCCS